MQYNLITNKGAGCIWKIRPFSKVIPLKLFYTWPWYIPRKILRRALRGGFCGGCEWAFNY